MTLLWGLLVVASTALIALFGADVPSGFWDTRRGWFVFAVLVLFFSGARSVILEFLGERSVLEERRAQDALKAAYVQIVEVTSIDYRDLGLHAFLMRREPLRPWRWRLVRVGRWRLKSAPPVTGIDWTRGKGLIGRCWELRESVGANLVEEWGVDTLNEDEWHHLDPGLRYGLGYGEYLRVQGYGAIVAVPILDDRGRFIGCISADAPGDSFDLLWDDRILEHLYDAGLWIRSATNLSRV